MREFTLTIPAPCGWLNANDRGHWRLRNDMIRTWRETARQAAIAAKLPMLARAHITATFRFQTAGRRDIHNWMPTAKAIIDGLVDHSVLPDDSTKFLTGPDLRVGEKLPKRLYAPVGVVVLTITEMTS